MSRFNYMPTSPWSNPNDVVEKNTNEIPVDFKTATVVQKRQKPKTKKQKGQKDDEVVEVAENKDI